MPEQRSISTSVDVPAAPARVWELACDTSRYADWVEATLEVVRTDGPAQLDSTYDERTRIAGPWTARTRWRVSEFDPPRRMVHQGEGVFAARDLSIVIEVEPGGEGSKLTITSRYVPSGPLGALIDRAVVGTVTRDQQRSADNFAALATREASAPAGTG